MNPLATYRTEIPKSVYHACKWIAGRYAWGNLADYIVEDDGKYLLEISQTEAVELYTDIYTDEAYPCAGGTVLEEFGKMWAFFEIEDIG